MGRGRTVSACLRITCALAMLSVAPVRDAAAQDGPEPSGQEPKPPAPPPDDFWRTLKVGLTFEGYYEYNANEPPDRSNALHIYDTRSNSFGIQQAAAVVEVPTAVDEGRRFGLRLDLQFGEATEAVQGSPLNEIRPDVYRHIWQAFGSYVFPVGHGLRVDAGKFASSLGIETNYAKDNQAFSRAFLFGFLPFYHSGVRATLPVGDRLTLQYALVNGIQQTEDFNNFKSSLVSAVVRPAAAVTWTINYYFGREEPDQGGVSGPGGPFHIVDTHLAAALTARTSAAIDVNYTSSAGQPGSARTTVTGLGAYLRQQLTGRLGAGLRYERVDDPDGLFSGEFQVVQEVTATAEYRLADGFLVRGEFRSDWSDVPYFPTTPNRLRSYQHTLLVGGVWWFGNKLGAW